MIVNVNFAQPVGIYNNFINKCVGKFCHCEVSVEIDIGQFRVLVDNALNDAFSPSLCQTILNNTESMSGTHTLAFYILFGGVVSVRFLDEANEDPFYQPIQDEIYDVIPMKVEEEQFYEIISWHIKHLGRSYDIPKALFSVTPFFPWQAAVPEKFFCSQLVMYMVSENNMWEVSRNLNIDHMSPDAVYECLLATVDFNEDEL